MITVVEQVNAWGERWAVWLAASLLDATILLAVVWLVWLAARRRAAPQLGYLLFLLVPLKLFVPGEIAVPERLADWTPARLLASALDYVQPTVDAAVVQPSVTEPPPAMSIERRHAEPSSADDAMDPRAGATQLPEEGIMQPVSLHPTAAAAIARLPDAPIAHRTRLSAWGGTMVVWAVAVVILLVRLLRVQVRFHRELRHARPFNLNGLPVDFQELCSRVGVRQHVRVVESEGLSSPAVWGVFRPTLVLPAGIVESLSARQLEWVLLHELAHVRRGDLAVNCFQRLATILHFVNPAIWVANRMINRLREYACDDLASALCVGSQVDASEAFLGVVRFTAQNRQRPTANLDGALGMFGADARASCFQRMRRLLDTDRRACVKLGLGSLCVLLLTATLALPHIHSANDPAHDETADATTAAPAEKDNDNQAVPSKPSDAHAAVGSDGAPPNSGRRFELLVRGPDEKPVPQADVEIRARPVLTAEQIEQGEFLRKGNYGVFVRTDAEGRLILELPENTRSFNVSINQPGFGPYWAGWTSDEHPETIPDQFVAKLEAGWSVGGIVVNEQGIPVEGVRVRPSIMYKKPPGDTNELGIGTRLVTDSSGRWRFDSVPDSMSEVFVEIDHPDYMPNRRRLARSEFGLEGEEQADKPIELQRGLTVTGRVTDDAGTPIPGATIRTKFSNDIREAQTDENGRFGLGGCEPSMARLVVFAPGRATDMQDVRIDPDMEPVNFHMSPGGKVRVRVLDETGAAVPKARIFFQRWRGDWFQYFEFNHISQYADEQGVWEWNEAPLDEFRADICPPGAEGMQLLEQPLQARDEEYVFRLPPPLVISGRVVDAGSGAAVESFRVIPGIRSSQTHMNWARGDSFAAATGEYRLQPNRGYLAHLVRIEAEGYQVAVSREIKSDEGDVRIDFKLKPAPDIAATVLTPDGRPAAGARIALGIAGSQINVTNGAIKDGSTYAARRDADEAGRFRFPSQGDAYQLVITHPAGFAYLKSAEQEIPNSIPLTAWARVEGTFHLGPQTVPSVSITLNVNSVHSYGEDVPSIFTQHEVTTGAEGKFVFERAFPGQGRIGRGILLMAGDGAAEVTSSQMEPVLLKAGETLDIDLGGFGHAVIGRLAPPAKFADKVLWNFALVHVTADVPEPLDEVMPYFTATVGRDGAFRIDDVPPGKYVLSVRFSEHPAGYVSDHRFAVPEIDDDQARQEFDLGVLTLQGN